MLLIPLFVYSSKIGFLTVLDLNINYCSGETAGANANPCPVPKTPAEVGKQTLKFTYAVGNLPATNGLKPTLTLSAFNGNGNRVSCYKGFVEIA